MFAFNACGFLVIMCTYCIPLSFLSRHTHVIVDRGVGWDKALQLHGEHLSGTKTEVADQPSPAASRGSGFYCSRREQFHQHLYLLALQKENSTHLFNIIRLFFNICTCISLLICLYVINVVEKRVFTVFQMCHRPNTGRSYFEETKADLLSKYVKIPPEKAGMHIPSLGSIIAIQNEG